MDDLLLDRLVSSTAVLHQGDFHFLFQWPRCSSLMPAGIAESVADLLHGGAPTASSLHTSTNIPTFSCAVGIVVDGSIRWLTIFLTSSLFDISVEPRSMRLATHEVVEFLSISMVIGNRSADVFIEVSVNDLTGSRTHYSKHSVPSCFFDTILQHRFLLH
jgi:hypothetical protein